LVCDLLNRVDYGVDLGRLRRRGFDVGCRSRSFLAHLCSVLYHYFSLLDWKGFLEVKKPRRRIVRNTELRNELIAKGYIVPYSMVPAWLAQRGFLAAAQAAAEKRGIVL
jgi:hypothetical protein